MRVKSYSNVITNSSSEVFLVKKETKNYLEKKYFTGIDAIDTVHYSPTFLTWKWIKNNGRREWMMVMDVLGLPYTEVSTSGEEPSHDRWADFMERYRYDIQRKLMGTWWVDIDDHFSNFGEIREKLVENHKCLWHESRH